MKLLSIVILLSFCAASAFAHESTFTESLFGTSSEYEELALESYNSKCTEWKEQIKGVEGVVYISCGSPKDTGFSIHHRYESVGTVVYLIQ